MSTFGIIGACGHILLIIALSHAQASALAPFSYLGVLFGAFWPNEQRCRIIQKPNLRGW